MKLRAYILMLCVVAVWGSTFVVIKGALADATPAAFNLVRMALAFALLAIAYHRAWRGIRRSDLAAGAVVGLCLAAGYQFQTIGLVRTTPSKSAFITGLVVVLVPLFSTIPALRPPGAQAATMECVHWRWAGVRRDLAAHGASGCKGRACGAAFRTSRRSTGAMCSRSAVPSDLPFTASR